MTSTPSPRDGLHAGEAPASTLQHLQQLIAHAGHLLPAQGPITVFVHHNTLHAFEELPFEQAVQEGAQVFGCEPFLPEERYRQMLARERIRGSDLLTVLREDLGSRAHERIPGQVTRLELRLAMLQHPLPRGSVAELRWFVAETDALQRFRSDVSPAVKERLLGQTRHWVLRARPPGGRDAAQASEPEPRLQRLLDEAFEHLPEARMDAWTDDQWEAFCLQTLWRVCRDGIERLPPPAAGPPTMVRHRDLLLAATGEDSDRLVHDLLIRFCATFLDQGFAHWPLPEREAGFFRSFCALYQRAGGPPDVWLSDLARELRRWEEAGLGPLEAIRESLGLLGVGESEWDAYLSASLLALRGWAGMIREMEQRADRVALPAPQGSLVEFAAVRLLLERLAVAHVARQSLGYAGPLAELRGVLPTKLRPPQTDRIDQRAFPVFQLAQVLGWLPADLYRLAPEGWAALVEEIEAFSEVERRRVFHLAFERRYYTQTLDALSVHSRAAVVPQRPPRFQAVCCIDDREESFRRHLEELAPDCETFGFPGFYAVAMYYRGAADAHFVPLCPVVIRPQHWVTEDVVYTLEESHRRRAKTRQAVGTVSHQVHMGSRTFTGGALLTAGLGILASVPLVARVLFPRLTSRIRRAASRLLQPPSLTQLQLERTAEPPGADGERLGFTLDEMVGIAERVLRDMGLTSNFARLVLLFGHGSNSLNNPHKSAYDCGACGGGNGGPNARALAQILNDVRVRQRLAERGLPVPVETYFVGAFHNTCNDSVTYFDLARLPRSHQAEFHHIQELVDQACDRNAHERCRRFVSAPLNLSSAGARRHVEGRAEDLAQTRPECGHATNALCIVGRRERTRGLFLDRRAFLTSYDPTTDDAERTILTRILQAAVPVCGGINLEYYFSYVDNTGFGCGTKLPHNIASLLGVMDGAASDLRPGLPWQMVEIHEPVRLLFIIETTPEAMLQIMDRNPGIGRLCRNGWVQVATLAPDSAAIHVFQNGRFQAYAPETDELPGAASSVEWYRGLRDHLGFAQIDAAIPGSQASEGGISA